MKKILPLVLILLACMGNSFAQNYEWAHFLHSDYTAYFQNVEDMTMDDDGNIYTLGTYRRDRVIQGDTIKIHTFERYSCYIMKHNPEGELQWINPIGTKSYDEANSLVYMNGALYTTMHLQGDTIFHRDGKLKRPSTTPYDNMVLKLELDGSLNDTAYFAQVLGFSSMEAIDTLLYVSYGNIIYKLNDNLEIVGQINFASNSYVTFHDIQSVNDTAVLVTGVFGNTMSYQGTAIVDTFSGAGYAAFYGLISTNDSLHWLKSFGNVYLDLNSAYDKVSDKLYLAGNYTDDFELQGHTFPLVKINGSHSFIASFDLQGNLQKTGQFNPMGSGSVILTGIMAENNRVFTYGNSGYGTVNYNFQDTIVTDKQRFAFLFKLDQDLNFMYHTEIHAVSNEANITTGVINGDGLYFGGRAHGSGVQMGCDLHETGGYFISHIEDTPPDETPYVRLYYIPRLQGKYHFYSRLDNHDYHYWDFGDGTPFDSLAIEPVHQYNKKGEIKVRLVAGNKCGENVAEKSIFIKGIGSLTPEKSANTNLYLGHIKGVGFKPGATFKLVSETGVEKEIREVVFIDSLSYSIMVEFYDTPLTNYHLYMENGDDKDTLLNALELTRYEEPRIFCEWLGPKQILARRNFAFTLRVHNLSNVTAYSVPVTIAVSELDEIHLTSSLFRNDFVNSWLDNGGPFRTIPLNEAKDIKLAPYIIPQIRPKSYVEISVLASSGVGFIPELGAYYDPPIYSSTDFFEEPVEDSTQNNTDAIDATQDMCPANPEFEGLLAIFGIDANTEAGFNLASLGCTMYTYITETFGSVSGFGGSGYGGGNPPNVFTGNPAPFPPGNTTPINMGPLIYQSLKDKNPEASEAEIMEKYEDIAKTIPGHDSGDEELASNGISVEVEYPEDIFCVGVCDQEVKVVRKGTDENGEIYVLIDEDNVYIEDEDRSDLHPPIYTDEEAEKFKATVKNHITGEEESSLTLSEAIKTVLRQPAFLLTYYAGLVFEVKAARDPNEKYTMYGVGDNNYVNIQQDMSYLITFENADTATAAASEVFVFDTLDLSVLDTNNFQWTTFGWGDYDFTIDQKGSHVIEEVDMRIYGGNIILRFEGKVDSAGVLSAVYTSLDTATWVLTNNINDGFLPPNVSAPEGEGYFSYKIGQKANLPHGTRIENMATIVFDYNDPIVTGTALNVIDTIAPLTSVKPFAKETQTDTIVEIIFEGDDLGSGIAKRNVYIKENNGAYVLIAKDYEFDTLYVSAKYGDTLNIYSFAEDFVGNREEKAIGSEAQIILVEPEVLGYDKQYSRKDEYRVYPNPASNMLYIDVNDDDVMVQVTLMDMSGKVWLRSNEENYLNVSTIPNGMYLVKINTKDDTYFTKIILQK